MKKVFMMIAIMICFVGMSFAQTGVMYINGEKTKVSEVKIKDQIIKYKDLSDIPNLNQYNETGETVIYTPPTKEIGVNEIDSITFINQSTFYSLKVFKNAQNYEIYNMRYNLNKMYKQYSTGTKIILTGTISAVIGTGLFVYSMNDSSGVEPIFGRVICALGSALMLTGYIVQIDSHKFLKKASVQYGVSPTSAQIKIIF